MFIILALCLSNCFARSNETDHLVTTIKNNQHGQFEPNIKVLGAHSFKGFFLINILHQTKQKYLGP